ncbi:hypothetical protein SUGI_0579210 [Cryptomeria japonica]|nr:hypothetical protein SUGI_0579210 [Cryptomeria japonica]
MKSTSLHIAIFSKNYAQSRWCLDELSFMFRTGTRIVPIFYYIDGRYSSKKLKKWKDTLFNVSHNIGYIINSKKDEDMLLKSIAYSVVKDIKKLPFMVAEHPVGLDEIVKYFELTTLQSNTSHQNVHIVGIWGMGGSGKTTLAKNLYNNKYPSMEKASLILDVRDAANKNLLYEKQKNLLEDLGFKSFVHNVEEGKAILTSNLRSIRELIVLDDVDHVDQLNAFLSRTGSEILIGPGKKSDLAIDGTDQGGKEFNDCSSQAELMVKTSRGIWSLAPSRLGLKLIVAQEFFENWRLGNHIWELWVADCDAPLQLRVSIISYCHQFDGLPKSIGSLKQLRKIVLQSAPCLESLPQELCLLHGLLSLPYSMGNLRNLRHLSLWRCEKLGRLPDSCKELTLLQHLNLRVYFNVTFMLDIMENMSKLEFLDFAGCKKLKELPRHITNQASLRDLDINTDGLRERIGGIESIYMVGGAGYTR